MSLTMGLQRESPSRGTLAIYSKIIFATMFEWILFHTLPSYFSVVGTLMIVVSALYIAVCSCPTLYPLHPELANRWILNDVADEGEDQGND